MRKLLFIILSLMSIQLSAQELNAKVVVNHEKISNTKDEVFQALQTTCQDFLNNHKWTGQTYRESEKITCNLNITVSKWKEEENSFKAKMLLTSTRPVYNSIYNTTVYSVEDPDFNFNFQTTDQIEWNPDYIDNNLVAMLAYYAYVIIGYDMDSFAPLGGTSMFQTAENIVSNAQNLGFAGWSSFNDSKNRFGLLNDLMDGSMEDFRQMTYKYHREGLDQMADNPEQGRQAISEAIQLLGNAKDARTMSQLPQLFADFKRDELANIYEGHGTTEEKNNVYDILFSINASQGDTWERIKK